MSETIFIQESIHSSFDENNDGVIIREEMNHFVKDIHHLFSEDDLPTVDIKSSCIALNSECKKAR